MKGPLGPPLGPIPYHIAKLIVHHSKFSHRMAEMGQQPPRCLQEARLLYLQKLPRQSLLSRTICMEFPRLGKLFHNIA